ncbi:DNA methylase N-4/N-6 domain protein [groundwater metagenome]
MTDNKNSLTLISEFLRMNGIDIDSEFYLKDFLIRSDDCIELPKDIITRIIGDSYKSSSELIKKISDDLVNKFNLFLGRVQKNQLKKYIDYRFNEDFEIFQNLIKEDYEQNINLREFCDKIIEKHNYTNSKAVEIYLQNLNEAIAENNHHRIQDYLIFLYSRLIGLNEQRKLSLKELYSSNETILKKELAADDLDHLMKVCSDTTKKDRFETINTFNSYYIRLLEHNGNYEDKNAVIYLNIDQQIFNEFNNKELFYSYLFDLIEKAYIKIQNHKTLIIKIQNIIFKDINLKWELYSYLTLFSEKFRSINETRFYYNPEEICKDVLEHKYAIKITDEETEILRRYYRSKIDFEVLKSLKILDFEDAKETIDYFKNINTGFTFIDCFILCSNQNFENSKEINFIKNNNELLLILAKHEFDERKIPCPVCGSLKISSNSYHEIGINSWECKNPLCSERSKTNRGKRYSERSILMQNATFDFSAENTISKQLIKIWRKDIVEEYKLETLYGMIVKYFSYVGDSITTINVENPILFTQITINQNRKIHSLNYKNFLEIDQHNFKRFKEFFEENTFFKQFIFNDSFTYDFDQKLTSIYTYNKKIKIINEDALIVLNKLKPNSIHNMVTSPPYYNAREYSQWKNLYSYLNDMYKITVAAHSALREGGVFFFNIGDIFDNENVIVKSKMGEKRLPLGAYIILLFQKVGFDLLDNIIWYKGEPQTNRHKNDGNYVPYYQRPANCYEHMFIFKKKGKLRLNNDFTENILKNNLQKFLPVYKIGVGGENRYGHTAPFPPDIPLFSILCFTNEKEIVLDPFSGSGTSAITSTKNNRIGVGIELNDEYVNLSLARAREEGIGSDLIKLNETENVINNFIPEPSKKYCLKSLDEFVY